MCVFGDCIRASRECMSAECQMICEVARNPKVDAAVIIMYLLLLAGGGIAIFNCVCKNTQQVDN